MMNQAMYKISAEKKEGNPIEFHEFLCCLWLEYLLKIGYHDNTFSSQNISRRISQFRGLI